MKKHCLEFNVKPGLWGMMQIINL